MTDDEYPVAVEVRCRACSGRVAVVCKRGSEDFLRFSSKMKRSASASKSLPREREFVFGKYVKMMRQPETPYCRKCKARGVVEQSDLLRAADEWRPGSRPVQLFLDIQPC